LLQHLTLVVPPSSGKSEQLEKREIAEILGRAMENLRLDTHQGSCLLSVSLAVETKLKINGEPFERLQHNYFTLQHKQSAQASYLLETRIFSAKSFAAV
jgi:hypothetical protein